VVDWHRFTPADFVYDFERDELAARAAFLAQLHRKKSVKEWLQLIIQERVELEEAAFVGMKNDFRLKSG
jgi:hypothetical protein